MYSFSSNSAFKQMYQISIISYEKTVLENAAITEILGNFLVPNCFYNKCKLK